MGLANTVRAMDGPRPGEPCRRWRRQTYLSLLEGCSREEASAILYGNVLGDDPVDDSTRAAAPIPDAFRRPGVLERTYPHPSQDVPGAQLVWWRASDNAIHTWDLARAIGTDERLNDDLVDAVWAQLEPAAAFLPRKRCLRAGQQRCDRQHRTEAALPPLTFCGRRPSPERRAGPLGRSPRRLSAECPVMGRGLEPRSRTDHPDLQLSRTPAPWR